MVENEENVNELEEKSTESTATDDQTETTDQKDETSPSAEPVVEVPKVELENQAYTHDLIETKNFTLQIDHYMTTGDMLVSMLLVANMAVMLLCRLLRDRK